MLLECGQWGKKLQMQCNFLGLCQLTVQGTALVPVLMSGSEAMVGMEKERSRSRAEQMDNLRDLLYLRSNDNVECMG